MIAVDNLFLRIILALIAFGCIAPLLGMLLQGADRILSARMQGRVGPPLLQPYYDVRKLLEKEDASVNKFQEIFVLLFFIFAVLSGVFFFAGLNILLVIFTYTLSSVMLILASNVSDSPYAGLGGAREALQVMAYEPAVLLFAVALFIATGSFEVSAVQSSSLPMIVSSPAIFLAFIFILTIKLRKSPFDISMSAHAHQDLVSGLKTEFSGKTLALLEAAHWYESILFMAWTGMFFINASPLSYLVAIVVCVVIYFIEIWIDNNYARVKWQVVLKSAWLVTLLAACINLPLLIFWFASGGVW